MSKMEMEIQVRWSDLDPNNHIKHSVYYDWGAMIRVRLFLVKGLDMELMRQHQIGPILFREEALFKREILMNDKLRIDLQVTKAKRDFTRWSIRHNITKEDGTVAATIHVDGAWIDTAKRKLAEPNSLFLNALKDAPVSDDFQWIE